MANDLITGDVISTFTRLTDHNWISRSGNDQNSGFVPLLDLGFDTGSRAGSSYDYGYVCETADHFYFNWSDDIIRVAKTDGTVTALDPGLGNILAVEVNPSQTKLAISDNQQRLRLVDVATFTLDATTPDVAPTENINVIKWLDDNTLFTGGNDSELLKYNSSLVQQAFTLSPAVSVPSVKDIYALDVSPDGNYVAAAFWNTTSLPESVAIYDSSTAVRVAVKATSVNRAGGVSFTPDSSKVVYGATSGGTVPVVGTLTVTGTDTQSTTAFPNPNNAPFVRAGQTIALGNKYSLVANVLNTSELTGRYYYIVDHENLEAVLGPVILPYQTAGDLWTQLNAITINDKANLTERELTGVVQVSGSPAAREVRVYHKESGRLLGTTTSDGTTGEWLVPVFTSDDVTVQCVGNGTELSEFYDNVQP